MIEHRNNEKMLVLVTPAGERNARGYHLDDLVLSVSRGDFGIEVSMHRDAGAFADDGSACWGDLTPDQARAMLFAMRDMIDDAIAWVAESETTPRAGE